MPKGGEWERDLSRALSLWWTEGDRNDLVWRTAGSGARATARSKTGQGTAGGAGDLMATHPDAAPLFQYWLIEAKRGYARTEPNKSINVLYWLDRPVGTKVPKLYSWWVKAEAERAQHNRCETAIFFRRTGKRACVLMRMGAFAELGAFNGEYRGTVLDIRPGWEGAQKTPLVIVDMEGFFAWCPPETIRLIVEQRAQPGPAAPKRVLIT